VVKARWRKGTTGELALRAGFAPYAATSIALYQGMASAMPRLTKKMSLGL
jgi:hypothetical protein